MSDARLPALLVLVLSAAIVGAALLSQYVGGLQPCQLCLYQRWPYYIAIAVTLIAVLVGDRATVPWGMALCALLFAGGAALAFYHVGVEQHWFQGPTSCTSPVLAADSIEALKQRLLAQPVVRCDEVPWALFGVSLAGWNFLASLGLVALCVVLFRRLRHRRAWQPA
jgi:disulfide bond formation protein DsbB